MKRLLYFLLFLMPMLAGAQQKNEHVLMLNKDSLREYGSLSLIRNWRFKEADDSSMAQIDYDDSQWPIVKPELDLSDEENKPYGKFNGIGWFRLHILSDSTIANSPISLALTHFGASEIYLDGKKIKTYGVINGKDSTEYYNPSSIPIVVVLSQPGSHLLAVRYANFNAQKNIKRFASYFAGFKIRLAAANGCIENNHDGVVTTTFVMVLLFGLFLALSIAHLFLFLYYRVALSNLYFSIYCMALALVFFLPWLSMVSSNPLYVLSIYFTVPLLVSAICFSLSGFVNHLFSVSKKRFFILAICSLIAPFVYWLDTGAGNAVFLVLVFAVIIEAFVLIVRAIYRRMRGAVIIGAGVLLFILFFFFTLIYSIIQPLTFDGDSPWLWVFLTLAALAIVSLPISMSLYLAWSFAFVNKELNDNLVQVKELSEKTIAQELEKNRIVETQNEMLEQEVAIRTAEVVTQKEEIQKQHNELKTEKQKSDDLLLNILPEEIAAELKEKGHSDAKLFNDVTVLFTDFVNFTSAGERMSPQELVDELHICFKTFDEISSKYNVEKIKTIGDAYLAVGGLPIADAHHAITVVRAAQEIQDFMKERMRQLGDKTFLVRIGIHSGSVVAGIVGIKKFAYDIWGDTVNTAARMEQNSEAGRINLSESTYQLVKDAFVCTHRGKIQAKNKGELNMYFVEHVK